MYEQSIQIVVRNELCISYQHVHYICFESLRTEYVLHILIMMILICEQVQDIDHVKIIEIDACKKKHYLI